MTGLFGGRTIVTVGLTSLTGCGLATAKCEINDPHFYLEAPADLGNGLMTRLGSPMTYSSASWATEAREVVDCETGEQVHIIYFQFNSFSPDDEPIDLRGEPNVDAFEALFQERRAFGDIQEVKERAAAAGLTVESRALDREDCGCSVFYPHLRGDKPAYEDQT